MNNEKGLVYLVGHRGPDHNKVISVHRRYEAALNAWNQVRKNLIQQARIELRENPELKRMYRKIIDNLSCDDPQKINNSPHDTPYIESRELQD